ncbi:MAG: hypothetical protein IKN81_00280 [Oscillospiraceae bacterium]|nr:hypothetical protein [Oscillospiraceae bacterium]
MAKAPKKKKEKKEKKPRRPKRVPLPPVPLTPRDMLLSIGASLFFVLSFVCMLLALQAAIHGDGQAPVRRTPSRSATSAAQSSMWFGLPDGSFVNELGDPFVAPPTTVYQPPQPEAPAAPEPEVAPAPAPEVETPDQPAEPETPTEEPAPISNGQDWTIMVWIAQRGGRYHSRSDCPEIGSATPREATIQEAVALDCTRCESCWQD